MEHYNGALQIKARPRRLKLKDQLVIIKKLLQMVDKSPLSPICPTLALDPNQKALACWQIEMILKIVGSGQVKCISATAGT